jgi:hypothetical protein
VCRCVGARASAQPATNFQHVLLPPRARLRIPGHPAQPDRGDSEPLPGRRSATEASLVRLHDSRPSYLPRLPSSWGRCSPATNLAVVATATMVGVLAAVVQFLGLARWPFLVAALARTYHDPPRVKPRERHPRLCSSRSTATSLWRSESASGTSSPEPGPCSSASRCSSRPRSRRGSPGLEARSLFLAVGSLEFVGRFEEQGWKAAGAIVPIAYTAWSLWLMGVGLVLLFG